MVSAISIGGIASNTPIACRRHWFASIAMTISQTLLTEMQSVHLFGILDLDLVPEETG